MNRGAAISIIAERTPCGDAKGYGGMESAFSQNSPLIDRH